MENNAPINNKAIPTHTRHRSSSEGMIVPPKRTSSGSTVTPAERTSAVHIEAVAAKIFEMKLEDKSGQSNRSTLIIHDYDDSLLQENPSDIPSKRKSIFKPSSSSENANPLKSPNNSPLAVRKHIPLTRTQSQSESSFVLANINRNSRPLSTNSTLPFERTLLPDEVKALHAFQKACASFLMLLDKATKELKKSLVTLSKLKNMRFKIILKYALNSLPTNQFNIAANKLLEINSKKKHIDFFNQMHRHVNVLQAEHNQHKTRLICSREILMSEDPFPRVQLTKFLKAHGTEEDVKIVKWLERLHSKNLSFGPKQYVSELLFNFPSKMWGESLETLKVLFKNDPSNPENLEKVFNFVEQVYEYLDQRYFQENEATSFVNSFYFEEALHSAFQCSINADLDLLIDDPSHDKTTLQLIHKAIGLHKESKETILEKEIFSRIQEALCNDIKIYFKENPRDTTLDVKQFVHNLFGKWLTEQQAFKIATDSLRQCVETLPHVLRHEGRKSNNLITLLKDLRHALQRLETDPFNAFSKLLSICNNPSPEIQSLMRDMLGGPQAITQLKYIHNHELPSFLILFAQTTLFSPQEIATHQRISWPSASTQLLQNICLPKIERTLMVNGRINFEKLIIDGQEFDAKAYQVPSGQDVLSKDRTYMDEFFRQLIIKLGSDWWLESLAEIPDMLITYQKIGKEMTDKDVNPEVLELTSPYTQRLQREIPPFFVFQASSMEMWSLGEQKMREEIPALFPLSTAKTFFTKVDKDLSMTLEWSFNEKDQQISVSLQRRFQFEMNINQAPWKKTFGGYDLKMNFLFNKQGKLLEQALTMPSLSFDADAPQEHRQTILFALAKQMMK